MSRITSLHTILPQRPAPAGEFAGHISGPDPASVPRTSALRWTVLEGPQTGAIFQTCEEIVTIGASPDNAVVLADPTVSWKHAAVRATPGGLIIKDLRARNGTMVDGHRVIMTYLEPGSRIKLGQTTLEVQLAGGWADEQPEDRFGQMLGRAPASRILFATLRRIAVTETTLILCGETGSGKEVAARAVHDESRRSGGPFVVLDCSCLDRDLVGSELFGHETGAFTGATSRRIGVFEQANGGTLLIDELGELPLELQTKLLRVLERREIKRLGGTQTIPVDCRVIAATHRNLPEMVHEARFRQDLYFRLAQLMVWLPPLRERREDIPLLVGHILRSMATPGTPPRRITPGAVSVLASLPLLGNVRELKNLIHRACAMATGPEIERGDLQHETSRCSEPPTLDLMSRGGPPSGRAPTNIAAGLLQTAEREVILRALEQHGYNRMRAAADLGISVPTLRARIRRYRIALPQLT